MASTLCLYLAALTATGDGTAILLDFSSSACLFGGVGGLSGGGATSKLLPSYAEPTRSELLDILFKPKFLGALQVLKVEIGGDACSTEGSEASHMHVADPELASCDRGYELWLAREARRRNPNITLYGLPWAFPSWLGEGTAASGGKPNPLKNATRLASYIVAWLRCAADKGLSIDIIGSWNEMDEEFADAGPDYLKTLRAALDAAGFQSTTIIAGDVHSWAPSKQMLHDPGLARVVGIVGKHYPGTKSDPDAQRVFQTLGKPLWSSEDFASDNDKPNGGRCEARIINQNWVNGNISATISWNLISSYYSYLAWPASGLMTANTPWSGHYEINPPIYAAGHTTIFTQPGWTLLDVGRGSGTLPAGGSFVGYVAPGALDFTLVLEKVVAAESSCRFESTPSYAVGNETVSFKLPGGFRSRTLRLWRSNFGAGTFMQPQGVVPVGNDGTISIHVSIDDLVTASTVDWGGVPRLAPPAPPSAFPSVINETFESYSPGQEASLFAQMTGAFEVTTDASRGGNVLRQAAVNFPVLWLRPDLAPFTQVGDGQWGTTSVSVAVQPPIDNGIAFVAAVASLHTTDGLGVFFGIEKNGSWMLTTGLSQLIKGQLVASGSVPALEGYAAVTLNVEGVSGDGGIFVSSSIDGSQVWTGRWPASPAHGTVALGCSTYSEARFDDVHIKAVPIPPSPPPSPPPGPGPRPPPKPQKPCRAPRLGSRAKIYECADISKPEQRWVYSESSQTICLRETPGICLGEASLTDFRAIRESGICSGVCLVATAAKNATRFTAPAENPGKVVVISGAAGADQPRHSPAKQQCLDIDMRSVPGVPGGTGLEIYGCNKSNKGNGPNQDFAYDEATGFLTSALYVAGQGCITLCG